MSKEAQVHRFLKSLHRETINANRKFQRLKRMLIRHVKKDQAPVRLVTKTVIARQQLEQYIEACDEVIIIMENKLNISHDDTN